MGQEPPVTSETRARARDLLERGYRLQLEGRVEPATSCYRGSLELEPTSLGHTFLAWALATQGDVDAAIRHCVEAIRLDPGFGNPWSDLGAYLLEKGQAERARAVLERALGKTNFERHHYSHANLARVYRKQGLLMKALEELHRARALEPRDAQVKKAIREIQRNFN